MRDASKEFYPMNIFHSRYSGTYSGGAYILVAGTHNPRQETDAVGSDPDCMAFWSTVENEGPLIEIQTKGGNTDEIYVDSGPHPAVLYQRYCDFCEQHINRNVSEVVTRTLRDYPDIEKSARENTVDLHKLNIIAESRYKIKEGTTGSNYVSNELASRFTEYDSVPPVEELDSNEKSQLAEFEKNVDENIQSTLKYSGL